MPGQRSLLIGFGTSRHYRLIPIRQYVEALGPKSMVKLSSMLYLAVIQQLAFLAMVRAGASKRGITTP